MKKAIILIFFFLCGSITVWAQGTIYIHEVDVIPTNPTINDSIQVRVLVVGTDFGPKIYDSLSFSGDTIYINYCVSTTGLTSVRTMIDTFELGTLPAADYTVQVKAFKSALGPNPVDCNNHIHSDTVNKPFTVTDNFSVKEEKLNNGLSAHVMPNPAENLQQLILKTEKAGSISIQICDLSGRVIMDIVSGNVQAGEHSFTADLTNLKSGMYVYRVSDGENILILKTLKN